MFAVSAEALQSSWAVPMGFAYHSLDANHAFERKVRLVRKRAREIVGADLIRRDERVLDQVVGPLLESVVMLAQEARVTSTLNNRKRHYEHVPTYQNRS